jgi:hypothetical protein
MVAFNFQSDFVPKIESGLKCSTIRRTMRCKIGDTMQLYTGQRTKDCQKIKDAICVGLAEVWITEGDIWEVVGRIGDLHPTGLRLHEQEGFINAQEFVNFFKQKYTLPFKGYLHAWK